MINQTLERELGLKDWQVRKIISLIDEGNTIPFIARYRKDVTGNVNDETLRTFNKRLEYLRNLEEKKDKYLKKIDSLGKLSDSLKDKIISATTLVELEDLYMPFKSKRKTKATVARQKGLDRLADIILEQKDKRPVDKIAEDFLSDDVETVEDAVSGARDIIAETVSENSEFRGRIRENMFRHGFIRTKAKRDEVSDYEIYYDYREKISKIPPHRLLAINRAENEEFITVRLETDDDEILNYLNRHVIKRHNKNTVEVLREAIKDSYKRLIKPSITREVRNQLTEKAERKSIKVFSRNLYQLLMESPLKGKRILGWDPAFRTGCKLAAIDETGKVIDTALIYPTEPQNRVAESKEIVLDLIDRHDIDIIAIGNGTASRESEEIVADIISGTDVEYIIVNEAGASVYSASEIGTEEFPDFSEGERSAVSIARRLQDPLAELVKIDPKSIGVGQYQHDMNQKQLGESLEEVIETVVNSVGIDLNTASVSLLNYISGINKSIARNIVEYRQDNGIFKSRDELLKVRKLGEKTFKQCAGFIKVSESENPLDNTTIHPESYGIGEKLIGSDLDNVDLEKLSQELDVGIITLRDIVDELKKPSRDPRESMPKPVLRKEVMTIEDLEEDMIVQGTVRNIVDFGAFVDIGVHQDGLVHISQLVEDRFVKHPLDVVNVGEIVDVKVLDVDTSRGRINLSMII